MERKREFMWKRWAKGVKLGELKFFLVGTWRTKIDVCYSFLLIKPEIWEAINFTTVIYN